MEQALGEPVDEKVVEFALQSLAQDGLLEPANSLFAASGMTRRDLIQKVGVRTGVALRLVTALLGRHAQGARIQQTPQPGPPSSSSRISD